MFFESTKSYNSFFFVLAFILNSCLGSFNVGYLLGELNLLIIDLRHIYSWTESEYLLYTGLLNGFLPIGAIIGAILAGIYSGRIGRKSTLIIADCFTFVGSFICIFPGEAAYPQIIGRILSGFSSGINCYTIPLYINELAPNELSGFMGSFFQSFLCIGIMFSYLMGLNIPSDSQNYNIQDNWWKFVFAFPMITSSVRSFFLLKYYKFDTPFSLMKRNKESEIPDVLKKIYKQDFIETVVKNVENKIHSERDVSYQELFTTYRSRLFLGAMLMGVEQLSGVNAVVTESSLLYNSIGDSYEVKLLTFMNSVILFSSALLSGVLSNRFGRRTLILFGNAGCCFCLFLMAIFEFYNNTVMNDLTILMVYLFLFSFGFSLGPVIWVYEPEIIPDRGMTIVVIINQFLVWFVVFFTPILSGVLGISPIYFFFAIFLLIAQIYLYKFMKETKDLNSVEIDEIFSKEGMMGKLKDSNTELTTSNEKY